MLKVLLVDDEPFILLGLSTPINWDNEGYEIVYTCSNGKEALDYLIGNKVDLIIADIKMPVMSGIELLKNIREKNITDAFFVFLSGYGDFVYTKEAIQQNATDYILKPVQKEQLIELLGRVSGFACTARQEKKKRIVPSIMYYSEGEESLPVSIITKATMDMLLEAVVENDKEKMQSAVAEVYKQIKEEDMDAEFVRMNMNYMLLRLVHLAMEQDPDVNQNEIIQMIRENAFDEETDNGNRGHFEKLIHDFADYLCQLRSNVSRSVLSDIENYVKEHYSQNISLKELSQKFFINSAYLGQIFKKQYGVSFREYLNKFRIEKAAEMLLKTDDKIYAIAEQVGYHDPDYFINKFIAVKGCTPTSYRRNTRK